MYYSGFGVDLDWTLKGAKRPARATPPAESSGIKRADWDELKKVKDKYTRTHFLTLCRLLSTYSPITPKNAEIVIEILRQIAELMLWGDQNNEEEFLNLFLEKNVLHNMMEVVNSNLNRPQIQLIQTLSILIENLRNEVSLFLILSNNRVNNLISYNLDFKDEDLMAIYISFLKTIGIRLNCRTINFFFDEREGKFQLFTEAIKFISASESMVRTSARTLAITIFRLIIDQGDPMPVLKKYLIEKGACPFLSNIFSFFFQWINNIQTIHDMTPDMRRSKIGGFSGEILDLLDYVQDIFGLNVPDVNELTSFYFFHFFLDVLVAFVFDSEIENVTVPIGFGKNVGLYVLANTLQCFQEEKTLDRLCARLLGLQSQYDPIAIPYHLSNVSVTLPSHIDSALPISRDPLLCPHAPLSQLCNVLSSDDDTTIFGSLGLLLQLLNTKTVDSQYGDLLKSVQGTSMVVDSLTGFLLQVEKFRVITVKMALEMLNRFLVLNADRPYKMTEDQLFKCQMAYETVVSRLRSRFLANHDHSFDMLLLFEEIVKAESSDTVNYEKMTTIPYVLLPIPEGPSAGYSFDQRLPVGEKEETIKTIKIFLLLRKLRNKLDGKEETQIPLKEDSDPSPPETYPLINSVINAFDFQKLDEEIVCNSVGAEGNGQRMFLVGNNNEHVLLVEKTRLTPKPKVFNVFFRSLIPISRFAGESKITPDARSIDIENHCTFTFDSEAKCRRVFEWIQGRFFLKNKFKYAQLFKLMELNALRGFEMLKIDDMEYLMESGLLAETGHLITEDEVEEARLSFLSNSSVASPSSGPFSRPASPSDFAESQATEIPLNDVDLSLVASSSSSSPITASHITVSHINSDDQPQESKDEKVDDEPVAVVEDQPQESKDEKVADEPVAVVEDQPQESKDIQVVDEPVVVVEDQV